MTTRRENILDGVVAALAGTTGVSTRIYRSRAVALSRAETPALIVEWSTDTPDRVSAGTSLSWDLTVTVSVVVRGDKPDEIADPIIESLHNKITGDVTLSGLCFDVVPGPHSLQIVDADQPAGVVGCEYVIRYRTRETDLSQAA
tara:strand:+ start:1675 stop:2106 length:432 start_codon:yes stop_codon:yes gene_type:complete